MLGASANTFGRWITASPLRAAELPVPTANALSILCWCFQHQETQSWFPMRLLQCYNLSTSRKLHANWHESLVARLSFLTYYIGVGTKYFRSTKARTAHANSMIWAHSPPQQDLRTFIWRLAGLLKSYIPPYYKILFKGTLLRHCHFFSCSITWGFKGLWSPL